MPPPLAALFCLFFIGYLFHQELRRPGRDRISWAPFTWMFLAGSRYVSSWLNLRGPGGLEGYSEGSPVDRAAFFAVIIWGVVVLARRDIDWRRLVAGNKWLLLYFAYCLISIIWSDAPFVLFKRWVKDLGNPIIAIVLLTERRPYDAVVTTLRRLSLVFIPLSVLFIRYYPELGRGYTASGATLYTGVGQQKNSLGLICLTTGICYAWMFLWQRRPIVRMHIVLVVATCWLLYMSNSQTSVTCLVVCIAILVFAKAPAVARRPTRVMSLSVAGAVLYLITDSLFPLKAYILELLGRDASLTNRTDVWAVLLKFEANPLVGSGFMTFWSGERMASIWKEIQAPINQAHNGYLEQYLNLGYVGVGFIIGVLFFGLLDVRRRFSDDLPGSLLRFSFIIAAILYNYTEASFYGINNMWVLTLVGSIHTATGHAAKLQNPWQVTTRLRSAQATAGGILRPTGSPSYPVQRLSRNSRARGNISEQPVVNLTQSSERKRRGLDDWS
jgi:exopolysaccharide production protein ExoQ